MQAYDWIFERLNQKFDDKASKLDKQSKPLPTFKATLNDDVMLALNGKQIEFFGLADIIIIIIDVSMFSDLHSEFLLSKICVPKAAEQHSINA